MHAATYQHIPVMAGEAAEYLQPAAGKIIVDCTLGGGGHAEKLEAQNSKVKIIGMDRDGEAIAAARERLAGFDNIEYVHDNFSNLKRHVKEKVDGFLFDLGVSSYQIDAPARGFSLQQDGPLDMRMDKGQGLTAADILNHSGVEELESIFRDLGEERFARRIARAVVSHLPVETTFQLKAIVEKAIPTWRKRESVTRIFQALRIAVNSEIESLKTALRDSIPLLKSGGRIVVLSYHSLEDRVVKHLFRELSKDGILKVLTKKPVGAGPDEVNANPRSKSAKLRAAEKI
jgi:16S rRNA (cytosine1402-N4)-methyltransferase